MKNWSIYSFLFISILISLISCKYSKEPQMNNKTQDEILYRPNFHFSPRNNWMNDPNGMFFYKGNYHLYFQHNPYSNVWGPMHWGHAISKDLINWEEQPIAIFPDDLGTIFSGSSVVDLKNTSGFGSIENPPIVAIYTNHNAQKEKEGSKLFQNQSIAYSLDEGKTWTKYIGNPVIENPGIRDFRDPKVIWFDKGKKWILILAASQITKFYQSKDLKNWQYMSSFGEGIGNHEGVWECPDLFELYVEGTSISKWVHIVSINPGGPNGGSGTQYFVGDFDGKRFIIDPDFELQMKKNHSFWIDFGKDNYAGVTYNNWRSKRLGVLFQGWMSNWQYAGVVPTLKWRSAMTLPRELSLYLSQDSIYRIRSKDIINYKESYIKKAEKENINLNNTTLLTNKDEFDLTKAKIELEINNMEEVKYTFVLSNNIGDSLAFGYDHREKQFFIDRSNSGVVKFSENFAMKPSIAPRFSNDDNLKINFILDKTSVELFYDEGETVMTEIFFPSEPFHTLSLETLAKKTSLKNLKFQEIK